MRPVYATLEQLRDRLAVALGFGAQGGAQPNQIHILNHFLQQSQSQIWHSLKLNQMNRVHYENLGANQEVLDLPSDCRVGALTGVYWKDGDVWRRLHHGLPKEYDTTLRDDPRYYGVNSRYDSSSLQVQFYPVPCKVIEVRMDYYAQPSRFTQNKDHASVPEDLLITLVIVMGKAHYSQSDVQLYTSQFEEMMRRVRSLNFDSEGSFNASRPFDAYGRPVKWSNEWSG